MARPARDPLVRWWENVEVRGPDECWPWIGSLLKKGTSNERGRIAIGGQHGKTVQAHRFGYTELVGPIPDGMFVCHSCDNTICCNPKHWFLGTALDNMRDKMAKGRQVFPGPTNPASGERNGNVKLTREQVEEIRVIGKSMTVDAIASKFGIGRTQVRRILTGESWSK